MSDEARHAAIRSGLKEVLKNFGVDAALLILEQQISPNRAAVMLYTEGVGTAEQGVRMLEAARSFFPDDEDIEIMEPDGRSLLQ